jgi:tetratricopeptide (TPR) repeat protein
VKTPDPKRQQRTRIFLLGGIVVALAVSVVLHLRLAERREANEQAINSPESRAAEALQRATQAMVNRDLPSAHSALMEARVALDEGLEADKSHYKLRKARVEVAKRLAAVGAEEGSPAAEILAHLEDAAVRSAQLHEEDPANEGAQLERLATAREWGATLQKAENHAAAVDVLERGGLGVENASSGLVPTRNVRLALSEIWISAARSNSALKRGGPFIESIGRAISHASGATSDAADPIAAQARVYRRKAEAVKLSEQAGLPGQAEAFEREAISTLEVRWQMQPDELSLPRALAARLNRVADAAQKGGRYSKALEDHERALAVREQLLAKKPGDKDLVRDMVRGLNHIGAFYSDVDRDQDALLAYAKAAKAAEGLTDRTAVLTLGNYSQVLGRLDKTVEARDVARRSYELAVAQTERDPAPAARLDAAVSGLRYARLLRARPKANKKAARTVAQESRARLDGWVTTRSERYEKALTELEKLLAELR